MAKHSGRLAAIGVAAVVLAGCQGSDVPKQLKPVPRALVAAMEKLDMPATSKIFIRIFKEESTLEIWKERRDGTFALLDTYDICKWSGGLGPKRQEGDRQAPEGVYTVTPAQMNPRSSYYLSFNIGYPNAFDRSLGRTGSNLMVHGACSSAGCYSMTDESVGELFALARDSFRGGQTSFQIQAFPFRMTPENMARYRDDPNIDFWRMLKVGYDHFELTKRPPKTDVCDQRYVFNADAGEARFEPTRACPAYTVPESLAIAYAAKKAVDDQRYAQAVAALEMADQAAAGAEGLAAAKAAEEQQRTAATASETKRRATARRPSLISRWFGRRGGAADTAPTTVGSIAAGGKVEAAAPASVPVPRPRPAASPPVVATVIPRPPETAAQAEPEPAVAAKPAAGDQPVTASANPITPQMTPPSPPVGRFVKREFWWLEDPQAGSALETPG